MAQAVSCWSLTAESQVQSQASPDGICGAQSGIETGISQSTLVFPRHCYSTNTPYWQPFIYQQQCIILACDSVVNPLNAELNPNCKSQLAKLFCGVFKFCACFPKNLNISRTKRDKFVKQKAFCRERNRHCSDCLKNAVISLLCNGEDKFLKKLINIHVLLLTLWLRLQLFARKTKEKMSYKLFSVW